MSPRTRAHAAAPPIAAHGAEPVPRRRWLPATDVAALALLLAFLIGLGWVVVYAHPVPLYQVETDLLGEYVPAARDLLRGVIDPARFTSKGVGYPLLLAGSALLVRGDFYLAARLLNLLAATLAAGLGYLLCRALFTRGIALAVLAGLLVNAVFVQATVEAGTDLPAMALALGSIACLVLTRRDSPGPGAPPGGAPLIAAGLLAGLAVITRGNYAFLPLAAVLVAARRPRRGRSLALYAIGCALPVVLGAWLVRGASVTGGGTQNALNMAYEFYGAQLRDTFWASQSHRFRTLLDVVRFDPARFVSHLGANLATRWLQDIRVLLPLWLGVPAVAGIVLGAWRREGGLAIAAHFGLAYATLATVFYLPRFSLFLLPFYLSAAAWMLIAWMPPLRPERGAGAGLARLVQSARGIVWLALLVPTARSAATRERDLLVAAPYETRTAGDVLRRLGPDSAAVMACKPHVAFFAGMRYVPLPAVTSYAQLLDEARRGDARYLFFSRPETDRCPQFLALLDPGTRLPGLEPVGRDLEDGAHYFALYRFTGAPIDREALDRAAIEAARNLVAHQPGDLVPLASLADQLIQARRPREALAVLAPAARLAPAYAPVARIQALAYLDLGVVDSAGLAVQRVLGGGDATSWDWGVMGRVRLLQHRGLAAREAYRHALRLDPSRDEFHAGLARAESLAAHGGTTPGAPASAAAESASATGPGLGNPSRSR